MLEEDVSCDHGTASETCPMWNDPALAALIERGLAHEKSYVDYLRAQGLGIVDLPVDDGPESGYERTRGAMQDGAEIITQAWLLNEPWYGRADILRRVERPSRLGRWSYEVLDTKLARETRAGTVLQLCLYSEIVTSSSTARKPIDGTPMTTSASRIVSSIESLARSDRGRRTPGR
jgi:hypothetical protein